jgi:hypothetical protein
MRELGKREGECWKDHHWELLIKKLSKGEWGYGIIGLKEGNHGSMYKLEPGISSWKSSIATSAPLPQSNC